MVRVFDPRPPWWRSLVTFLLFIFAFAALPSSHQYALLPNDHSHLARFYYTDTAIEDPISIEWPYRVVTVDYAESVTVDPPRLYRGRDRKSLDAECVLASDKELADRLRKDFLARAGEWEGLAPADWSDCSTWQREAIFSIINSGIPGSSIKSHAHLRAIGIVVQAFWFVLAALIFSLLVGSLVVKRRVESLRNTIASWRCTRCKYDAKSSGSLICPECGLDIDRERRFLNAVHERGYRGLKRYLNKSSAQA